MTIALSTRKSGPYTATAGQTVFNYTFPLVDAADLQVIRYRDGVAATLSGSTDYVVTGVGLASGTFVLNVGAILGDIYVAVGDLPIERDADFPGFKSIPNNAINIELDRMIMAQQEMRRDIDGTVTVDPFTGDVDAKGHRIINVADGSDRQDAATYGQLQEAAFASALDVSALALIDTVATDDEFPVRDVSTGLLRKARSQQIADGLPFIQAGTGADTRTLRDKARERVSIEDFDKTAGSGFDDTATFLEAITQLSNAGGGDLCLGGGKRYLVDNNLALLPGVKLVGSRLLTAQSAQATVLNGSTIRLNPTKTITLPASTGLSGVNVVNKNILTAPRQDTQANYIADATAILALFAGTGLTVTGADVSIEKSFIGGFGQCIAGSAAHRLRLRTIMFDGLSGVLSDSALDVSRFYDVHGFPLLTSGRSGTTSEQAMWERSGNAFQLNGLNDGLTAAACFAFCYGSGFVVNGGQSVILSDCWVDHFGTLDRTASIGFHILGSSQLTQLNGCRASSVGRGVILNSDKHVEVIGWRSWATRATHIEHLQGDVNIVAPAMELYGAPSSVVALTVGASAGSCRVAAPYFKDFSNCYSVNAGVESNVSIIEPTYRNCTGTLRGTEVAQAAKLKSTLEVQGTRISTGVDGSNFFWFRNNIGTEPGSLIWGYTTNGSGVAQSVFLSPGANGGLTVDLSRVTAGLPLKVRSYTVATLPAGQAGDIAFASNGRAFAGSTGASNITTQGAGVGSGALTVHNGVNWQLPGMNSTIAA